VESLGEDVCLFSLLYGEADAFIREFLRALKSYKSLTHRGRKIVHFLDETYLKRGLLV